MGGKDENNENVNVDKLAKEAQNGNINNNIKNTIVTFPDENAMPKYKLN